MRCQFMILLENAAELQVTLITLVACDHYILISLVGLNKFDLLLASHGLCISPFNTFIFYI